MTEESCDPGGGRAGTATGDAGHSYVCHRRGRPVAMAGHALDRQEPSFEHLAALRLPLHVLAILTVRFIGTAHSWLLAARAACRPSRCRRPG